MAKEDIKTAQETPGIGPNTIGKSEQKKEELVTFLNKAELTAALVRAAIFEGTKEISTMRARRGSQGISFSIDDIVKLYVNAKDKKVALSMVSDQLFDIVASAKNSETMINSTNIEQWINEQNLKNGFPLEQSDIVLIIANTKNSMHSFNHAILALKKGNPILWNEKEVEAEAYLAAIGL